MIVWRSKVVKHMKQSHQVSESSQEFEKIQWAGLSHNIKESLEFSPYQCSQCTKIMKNSYALSRHILLCGGPKRDKNSDMVLEDSKDFIRNRQVEPIKCSKCGEKFDHIYSLNKHVRYCQKIPGVVRIIGDNKIEIAELNKDLMQISSIPLDKRHEKAREMAVKYCYKCEEETAIEKIRKIDRKSLCHKCNSTLLFKCQKCFNVYSKYRSVIHHLNSICNSQEEFKCLQCNYTARNISYVRNHSRSVHGTSNIECQKCKRKFKSTDYLRKHMRVCGLKPKFQCDDCPFKSKLKLYLRKHIFRSHMEPIVIDRRESVIISKQRFSRAMIHLKAHCSQCNKEQRLSDRLKNCRTCKKTLCYKCKTCNNNYTGDDENACNHVKGYLEAIKYECKRCGRGAISEKSLWMHEHNICGVKPTFGCRFCKYISNRKGDTIQHEKKKHSYKF
ncbi:zinc finger protein 43-like [Phymastichus coffea]|uniref:zinc finger protein 43-like n=1 Tax=Phymastichus coffea TaxID=108790 RepID=UPI00273B5AAA|nr:zinc finger protein 43-like [Phymastichus coffea]